MNVTRMLLGKLEFIIGVTRHYCLISKGGITKKSFLLDVDFKCYVQHCSMMTLRLFNTDNFSHVMLSDAFMVKNISFLS